MTGLNNARVIVAGAGAFGASIALALAEAGARVVLADPAAESDNASGVAAGMLAPAFEALLDEGAPPHLDLLRAAQALWPERAAGLGDIGLRRSGAIWVDLPGAAPRIGPYARAFEDMGVATQTVSARALRKRIPGLADGLGPGLLAAEDWRLQPRAALAALMTAARAAGVQVVRRAVLGFAPGAARLGGGETLDADCLVLATGAQIAGLAPELAALAPIKGQILRYAGRLAGDDRPVVRCAGGYAVQARDGLRVGATMEPGLADRHATPSATASLSHLAMQLFPDLDKAVAIPEAGVRATTPDGLPLIGPSAAPGVVLAVGARRNGWLLAPLVAGMAAAYLAGRDPGPYAGLLAARRFAPS